MNKIPLAIVINFEINSVEKDIPEILDHIKPPSIPKFAGKVRIVIGSDVTDLIHWLEG